MKFDVLAFQKPEIVSMKTAVLHIEVPRRQVIGMEEPKLPLILEFKKKTKKRSLNANAYFWEIAGKLADKLQTTKEAVYRQAIRDVGVYRIVSIDPDIADELISDWQSKGLGWIAEKMMSWYHDKQNVIFYRGSSVYNTKQMSRLIDWIVDEAKEQGIETLTPEERCRMLEDWERQSEKVSKSTAGGTVSETPPSGR